MSVWRQWWPCCYLTHRNCISSPASPFTLFLFDSKSYIQFNFNYICYLPLGQCFPILWCHQLTLSVLGHCPPPNHLHKSVTDTGLCFHPHGRWFQVYCAPRQERQTTVYTGEPQELVETHQLCQWSHSRWPLWAVTCGLVQWVTGQVFLRKFSLAWITPFFPITCLIVLNLREVPSVTTM